MEKRKSEQSIMVLKVQRSGSCLFSGDDIGVPRLDLPDLFLHHPNEGVVQEFLEPRTSLDVLGEAESENGDRYTACQTKHS